MAAVTRPVLGLTHESSQSSRANTDHGTISFNFTKIWQERVVGIPDALLGIFLAHKKCVLANEQQQAARPNAGPPKWKSTLPRPKWPIFPPLFRAHAHASPRRYLLSLSNTSPPLHLHLPSSLKSVSFMSWILILTIVKKSVWLVKSVGHAEHAMQMQLGYLKSRKKGPSPCGGYAVHPAQVWAGHSPAMYL
jgi:hypothetical protein